MFTTKNSEELQSQLNSLEGSVALVMTMGNLHDGHLSLVEKAQSEADHVIVTIYVNPLQFSANEDLDAYPRTLAEDMDKLDALGVDILYTPTDQEIYPNGMEQHTHVEVPTISYMYCGAYRQGHFLGVTTIVCKIFNMISPDVAIFGKKDYQQLTIIKKMVQDLCMPVKIIGMPTFREPSGLAMSSRNRYLTDKEKIRASGLYQALKWTESQLKSGVIEFRALEKQAIATLRQSKFDVEYFSICDQNTLAPAVVGDTKLVVLAATKFGKPRLIDNIIVDL